MNNIKIINESIKHEYEGNRSDFYNLGQIDIINFKNGNIIKVDAKDIIDVVDNAMLLMKKKYEYLFLFINSYKIMYISTYPSKISDTMAVDEKNNLWINMNFIYNICKMNHYNVFGLLFHEMFHVFLEHIVRFNKMFPKKDLSGLSKEMLKALNMKANLAMDYEINASMVADNIVDEDFFKKMNGFYKKEYTGLTWEDIYRKFGNKEYKEWLEKNGTKVSEEEMEIIDAIEKAAKVLSDPKSTDEDKARANRELQKVLNKFFGKNRESDIQDVFEEMKNTQLGSFGDLSDKMQDIIDDLYKDPSKMSEEQYDNLLEDIDNMSKEMAKHKSEIADRFKKTEEDTFSDIKKMRKELREAMKKLRNEKMGKAERKQVIDKIKDSLEDVISNDVDKQKNEKNRKERDKEREKEIKKEFKEKHPLRKLIKVLKNLMDLSGDPFNLVNKDSFDNMEDTIDILESITEKKISEIEKDDVEDLKPILSKLKNSLFIDLKGLLDNKTIINKTEKYMHNVLDSVFDFVEKALLEHLINPNLSDDKKISASLMAAEKMRLIGKILKTQKSWKASDEFKDGYTEMRNDLISLFKKDKKATLKKLYELGILNNSNLDSLDTRSKELFKELVANGEIKK